MLVILQVLISLCQVSNEPHLVEYRAHNIIILPSIVPAPAVSVYLNTNDDSVYQGTKLIITCTATVDSGVNTRINVNMMWSSEPAKIMTGQYIAISETSSSGLEYTSTVTIRPVNTTDSANYTCTVSVSPTIPHTDNITSSMNQKHMIDIRVKG